MALHEFDDFTVEQVVPDALTPEQLEDRARSVLEINYSAWVAKFVPDIISLENLAIKISPFDRNQWQAQALKISNPTRNDRYYLSYIQPDTDREPISVANSTGIMRVETYEPRFLGKPYPNVTDLEVAGGKITGSVERQAAAMLYLGLNHFDKGLKAAAYIVRKDTDLGPWLAGVGFRSRRNFPIERIGTQVLTYEHLEAGNIGNVQAALVSQYPFLAEVAENP